MFKSRFRTWNCEDFVKHTGDAGTMGTSYTKKRERVGVALNCDAHETRVEHVALTGRTFGEMGEMHRAAQNALFGIPIGIDCQLRLVKYIV